MAIRILWRVAGALAVIWGAATLAFALLHLVPGDPVDIMVGTSGSIDEAGKDRIREELGLNQPVLLQYFSFLGRLLVLDFGTSYRLGQPVLAIIGAQLWPTVQLALLAILFAAMLAGLTAILLRGRYARRVSSLIELLAISSPAFWTGMLLLTVFAFQLHWFPVTGGVGLRGLVLPALTLALPIAGILSQLLRHGIDGAERQPFVDSARARGLAEPVLLGRHLLRHASLPVLTLGAYIVGNLLGGTVIVEQLFGRSGLGRVTLDAITNRDLPVVMAMVVFAAIVFVAVNLLLDALSPVLDPRLRGV